MRRVDTNCGQAKMHVLDSSASNDSRCPACSRRCLASGAHCRTLSQPALRRAEDRGGGGQGEEGGGEWQEDGAGRRRRSALDRGRYRRRRRRHRGGWRRCGQRHRRGHRATRERHVVDAPVRVDVLAPHVPEVPLCNLQARGLLHVHRVRLLELLLRLGVLGLLLFDLLLEGVNLLFTQDVLAVRRGFGDISVLHVLLRLLLSCQPRLGLLPSLLALFQILGGLVHDQKPLLIVQLSTQSVVGLLCRPCAPVAILILGIITVVFLTILYNGERVLPLGGRRLHPMVVWVVMVKEFVMRFWLE